MAPATTDPRGRLLALARHRAKRKGIPFSITADDIEVPTFCPVLGLRLQRGEGVACDASPTVDRIKPDLGYVPGNVLVVSFRANRLKGDSDASELIYVAAFYQQLTGHP